MIADWQARWGVFVQHTEIRFLDFSGKITSSFVSNCREPCRIMSVCVSNYNRIAVGKKMLEGGLVFRRAATFGREIEVDDFDVRISEFHSDPL